MDECESGGDLVAPPRAARLETLRKASPSQQDPMIALCTWVAALDFSSLPSGIVECAKRSILDTLAVIVGGSAMEGVPTIVDLVKERGGKPETYLPFYGGKVPASEAGLALGPMARAMDMGQVHEEAGHCSEYVLPALLAATGLKAQVSGREFIVAFVAGQEVLLRIGLGLKAHSRGRGHGMGHYIFGAVAAVGRLLGLTPLELENAEGIARDMTQGDDLAKYNPLTQMVRVHHGFICQDAVNACILASRGITGPRDSILTGSKGFLASATWTTEPEAIDSELGRSWELLNVITKPYASCMGTHTAVFGVLELMEQLGLRPEAVETISVVLNPQCWETTCEPRQTKWNPQTVAECQFSLPYSVATAAFDGRVFLDSYAESARSRADVRALMSRISARSDPSLPLFSAAVTVGLRDGRSFSRVCSRAPGHPTIPLSEQELVAKFRACAGFCAYPLDQQAVDSVVGSLLNLESVPDFVGSIVEPLTPTA